MKKVFRLLGGTAILTFFLVGCGVQHRPHNPVHHVAAKPPQMSSLPSHIQPVACPYVPTKKQNKKISKMQPMNQPQRHILSLKRTPTVHANTNPFEILGFVTDYSKADTSYQDVIHHHSVNTIASDSYSVRSDGSIHGNDIQPLISFAKHHHIAIYATLNNVGGAGDPIDTVLKSHRKTQRLESNLVSITRHGYTGIDLDLEGIDSSNRGAFSSFVKTLAIRLHHHGKRLTVVVPPIWSATSASWYKAYDYKAIGDNADEVILMAYDYTYVNNPAGPIAPLPWVKEVIRHAKRLIPAKKLILGMPAYGYDWGKKPSKKGTPWATARNLTGIEDQIAQERLTVHWNSYASSPYVVYVKNGVTHTVYFENEQSIRDKVDTAKNAHLRGVAIWRMGLEDSLFLRAFH